VSWCEEKGWREGWFPGHKLGNMGEVAAMVSGVNLSTHSTWKREFCFATT